MRRWTDHQTCARLGAACLAMLPSLANAPAVHAAPTLAANLDVGGPVGPGEASSATVGMTSTPGPDSDLRFKVSGSFDVAYAP